ncbi:MAG: hypothetical protein AAF798_18930 [Bacteroidota bacterium]
MKSKRFKKYLYVALLLVSASAFSSCNRGYGCPNNFSVNDTVVELVKTAVTVVINK